LKEQDELKRVEERLRERYKRAEATLENRYNAAVNRAREALKVKESREGRRLLNMAHEYKSLSKNIEIGDNKSLNKETKQA